MEGLPAVAMEAIFNVGTLQPVSKGLKAMLAQSSSGTSSKVKSCTKFAFMLNTINTLSETELTHQFANKNTCKTANPLSFGLPHFLLLIQPS
jgi:hypothetical protein